ncbi:hypothetical protein [Leptolinea tardivitalis]|uniref:Uncharacterized protein n=1 Tax=Leptolinea tardivitalis TaxID=229920 RepID=A0A0P6X6D5_9CHLR|nr:hypothetical protein [Leptolinea tardivitalis]KPL70497.1 hypothetical protein ADM99_15330 [Leptolinea tardivitalis]GAP22090.1 hypothetical protein LTAR_02312 [Leptolinea tardivitalis]
MYIGSDQLQSLVMARRLLLLNRQIEQQRSDPTVETKSFKEILEKDEISMSGGVESNLSEGKSSVPSSDVRLTDLLEQLGNI